MEGKTEMAVMLKTAPEIVYNNMKAIGESLRVRIGELDLKNLVVTDETKASIKKLRAELTKELKTYEDQRKSVETEVNKPVVAFKEAYKADISSVFTEAISTLKTNIDKCEDFQREERKTMLTNYFNELCLSYNIDFLETKDTGLKITLSASEKSLKDHLNKYIEGVANDIETIKTNEFQAELLVEYKRCLSLSSAIKSVNLRKEAERKENERLEKKKELEAKKSEEVASTESNKPTSTPLTTPTVKEPVKLVSASFKATATFEKLKALGQYMKDNGIEYTNIK